MQAVEQSINNVEKPSEDAWTKANSKQVGEEFSVGLDAYRVELSHDDRKYPRPIDRMSLAA